MKELDRERGLALLQFMVRIRRFEEKCAQLYGEMKIRGFLHLYVGQEAVAVGAISAIDAEVNREGAQAAIVSNYRDHGHALMRGIPMSAIMAEMFGRSGGCSRGRGGSMHLYDASRRFFGGQAIVGAGLPVAVGLALAERMLGGNSLAVCFLGDGATLEGVFHESLNLASLWALPVLFLCENNGYAMGTSLRRSHAQTDLSALAASHRIASRQVDGMDLLAVQDAVGQAASEVRGTGTPRFLELLTYRFRAHSMYDPDLYRSKTEIERWKKRDPILLFEAVLKERALLQEGDLETIERAVDTEIAEAIRFAETSPWEPESDLLKDLYTPAPMVPGGAHEPAA